MKILITICARGGSKGIPGKNIKAVGGMPLIGYSIKAAKAFAKGKDAVIGLSTDSEEIKEVAESLGLATEYLRPAVHATDKAGKVGAIEHVLHYEEKRLNTQFDYVLDLDVSSPLRTQKDLEEAFELILQDPEAYNLFSVSEARRNPYFNMVEQKDSGYYNLVPELSSPIFSRQKAPRVFDINGSFYIYRRSFFTDELNSAITPKTMIYEMKHLCFDLDEMLDYEFMDFLIKQNKLPIEI